MSEGRVLGGGGPIRRGTGPESGSELLEGSLHSSRDSPWHYHREGTARVSDRLNTGRGGGGREKVVKALHDINNHMVCTPVPVGLCVMSLSCWDVNSAVPELEGPGKCFCSTYKSAICRE